MPIAAALNQTYRNVSVVIWREVLEFDSVITRVLELDSDMGETE